MEMQCDKYLIYNSIAKEEYDRLSWKVPEGFRNPTVVMAGQEWEKILLSISE